MTNNYYLSTVTMALLLFTFYIIPEKIKTMDDSNIASKIYPSFHFITHAITFVILS